MVWEVHELSLADELRLRDAAIAASKLAAVFASIARLLEDPGDVAGLVDLIEISLGDGARIALAGLDGALDALHLPEEALRPWSGRTTRYISGGSLSRRRILMRGPYSLYQTIVITGGLEAAGHP